MREKGKGPFVIKIKENCWTHLALLYLFLYSANNSSVPDRKKSENNNNRSENRQRRSRLQIERQNPLYACLIVYSSLFRHADIIIMSFSS